MGSTKQEWTRQSKQWWWRSETCKWFVANLMVSFKVMKNICAIKLLACHYRLEVLFMTMDHWMNVESSLILSFKEQKSRRSFIIA